MRVVVTDLVGVGVKVVVPIVGVGIMVVAPVGVGVMVKRIDGVGVWVTDGFLVGVGDKVDEGVAVKAGDVLSAAKTINEWVTVLPPRVTLIVCGPGERFPGGVQCHSPRLSIVTLP